MEQKQFKRWFIFHKKSFHKYPYEDMAFKMNNRYWKIEKIKEKKEHYLLFLCEIKQGYKLNM